MAKNFKTQLAGQIGESLVVAELGRREIVATAFAGNVPDIDVLAFANSTTKQDPVQQRRQKLIAGIDEQLNVAAAAVKGESFQVAKKVWAKNVDGEKVLVERMRQVRAWFFEKDGGWYVQCKYGSRALALRNGNAVFVKALKEIEGALATLKMAAEAGELDEAIENVMKNKAKKAA